MKALLLEMPDDLARNLAGVAEAQRKTIEQVAIDRLRSLQEASEMASGSPSAVLRAMLDAPHPAISDVEALDAAIGAGRSPALAARDVFAE
jgi:hypothetical protein